MADLIMTEIKRWIDQMCTDADKKGDEYLLRARAAKILSDTPLAEVKWG